MIKIKVDKVILCKPADLEKMQLGNFKVAIIDLSFAKVIKKGEKLFDYTGTITKMAPEVSFFGDENRKDVC